MCETCVKYVFRDFNGEELAVAIKADVSAAVEVGVGILTPVYVAGLVFLLASCCCGGTTRAIHAMSSRLSRVLTVRFAGDGWWIFAGW